MSNKEKQINSINQIIDDVDYIIDDVKEVRDCFKMVKDNKISAKKMIKDCFEENDKLGSVIDLLGDILIEIKK